MASAKLSRTPSSSSNRRTWTWSAWVKRSNLSTGNQVLFEALDGSFPEKIQFTSSDRIEYDHDIAGTDYTIYSERRFRDTNAWYHIVVAKDTTQATETDRIKIYVNNEQVAMTEEALGYPGQNYEGAINKNIAHYIGANDSSEYFDGLMAHVNFVDGTALTPTSFGETDATTGIWKPKTSPSVTYGTNGYFLKMDNSANMGLDSAGSNNFTTNGTIIQTKDTPSNVFTTWSALHHSTQSISNVVFKNGNTTFDNNETSSAVYPQTYSTLAASSGKYYFESKLIATNTDASFIGISGAVTTEAYVGENAYTYVYRSNGVVRNNDTDGSTYTSYGVNDIIQIAVDLDNNKLYFGINGTWVNSGDPTSGATGTGAVYTITAPSSTPHGVYHFTLGDTSSSGTFEHSTNFGNGYFGTTAVSSAQNPDDGIGIFEYDVPAGYRALCTKSINAQEYS